MGDRRACIIPWETTVALTRSSLTYTVRSLCHCFHICDEEAEVNGRQWPQARPGLGFHGLRVPGVGKEGRGTLEGHLLADRTQQDKGTRWFPGVTLDNEGNQHKCWEP